MSRYVPYGVYLAPSTGSPVTIGGVTEQSIDHGVESTAEVTAGQESPQFGEVTKVQPGGQFTSHDVSKVMQAVGMKGICMSGGANAGFRLFSLKRNDCGGIASGSVHRSLTIPNGRIVPRTLSAQQGKRASIQCQVMSLYDGTNDPLIVTESLAKPTGLEDLVGYHLFELVVGGISIVKKTSLEVTFGNDIVAEYDDGNVFPSTLNINSHAPMIKANCFDVSVFGNGNDQIPLRGLMAEHADSYFVLRKKILGTAGYSAGDDHIKVTFGGMVFVTEHAATNNTPQFCSVSVTALDDGTNAMLVPTYDYEIV